MWPGYTAVSGGKRVDQVAIERSSVGQSAQGRSMRPTEPWNRTSPESSAACAGIGESQVAGTVAGREQHVDVETGELRRSPPESVCSGS